MCVGVFLVPVIDDLPETLLSFESEEALKLMLDDPLDPEGVIYGDGITFITWEKSVLNNTSTIWLFGNLYLDFDIITEIQIYEIFIDSEDEYFIVLNNTINLSEVLTDPVAMISTTEITEGITREFNVRVSFFDLDPITRVEIFNFNEDNLMFGGTILVGHGDWNVDIPNESEYIIILETFESGETLRTLYERDVYEAATFDVLMMSELGYAIPETIHLNWGE